MQRMIFLATALASAFGLAACTTTQDRTAGGAVLGGATGALVGAAVTGRPGGALVGAAVGAASGAMIGASTAAPRRCARIGYDYNGNRVCVAWY